jgi:hypothetical protein
MQLAWAILSPVACPGLQYFFALSHKRYDFRKRGIEHKICVVISYTNFVGNISHYKKNWERYDQKYMPVFMWSTCYFCQILMKSELSLQIFEKCSNITLYNNPPSGSWVVPCGQTDMVKRTVVFRKTENAPNIFFLAEGQILVS